jgi:hypothetical protein
MLTNAPVCFLTVINFYEMTANTPDHLEYYEMHSVCRRDADGIVLPDIGTDGEDIYEFDREAIWRLNKVSASTIVLMTRAILLSIVIAFVLFAFALAIVVSVAASMSVAVPISRAVAMSVAVAVTISIVISVVISVRAHSVFRVANDRNFVCNRSDGLLLAGDGVG